MLRRPAPHGAGRRLLFRGLGRSEDLDAGGRDLRGQAGGHDAVVGDAQALAHLVAAGVRGVDPHLLAGAQVADQQGVAEDLQHLGAHGDGVAGGAGGAGIGGAAAAILAAILRVSGTHKLSSPNMMI